MESGPCATAYTLPSEQHAAGFQYAQRRCHQLAVIFFSSEHAALFRLREGRRIKNNRVKRAPFLRETTQPVECVAVDEVVLRGIKTVQREVAFAPFQIFLREIEACDSCAAQPGADGEAAGVGKSIEDFGSGVWGLGSGKEFKVRGDVVRQKAAAVVALIEEQAHRVTFVETHLELHAVLADDEAFGCGLTRDELRRGLGGGCAPDVAGKYFVIKAGGEMISVGGGSAQVNIQFS